MVFSVLPGYVDFGALVRMVMEARIGSIPESPPFEPNPHKANVTLLGVAMPDGSFVPDDNPKAKWVIADAAWRWGCIKFILDAIKDHCSHVVLVMDNPDFPPRPVDFRVLYYVAPQILQYGVFETSDSRLSDLRAYERAAIFIQDRFGEIVVDLLQPPSEKGGRPKHPAYCWYEDRGFNRDGMTIKALQNNMPKDEAGNPPSSTTIREWEKKARRSDGDQ